MDIGCWINGTAKSFRNIGLKVGISFNNLVSSLKNPISF